MRYKIDTKVEREEICVRCLTTPMHYKNGKLQQIAFLPPSKKTDVSLLRLKFTTLEHCVNHGETLSTNRNSYIGLAFISPEILAKALESYYNDYEHSDISAIILGTPIDENKQYRTDIDNVYTDDPGLPMHADLTYNRENDPDVGEVRTHLRIIAQKIIELASLQLKET